MASSPGKFYASGTVVDQISVEISFQIIGLFSEGLYSSPSKALEELVSNSFDADATQTHVILPADLEAPGSAIVVLDNGTGMDDKALKVHWIVGDSVKRRNRTTRFGRRTIGKFGIGKLAAYVLGDRLTHISKSSGKYYSTSMDFTSVPKTADVEQVNPDPSIRPGPVSLDLRELTATQAKAALAQWLPDGQGLTSLKLFGRGALATWTVAIISDLKPLAIELSPGRLRWVLSTAMPLRDDFALYLNNEQVSPSKVAAKRIGRWVLGKELKTLPRPGPKNLKAEVGPSDRSDYRRWRVVDQLLGSITGYVEVFDAPIDTGKSEKVIGRSNGFFVYVNERLINPTDPGFGIDRNTLRHGTFSRFRVVVNIDRLDEELRSSREGLRDGPSQDRARALLQGLFNFARTKLDAHEATTTSGRKISERLLDSPASLVERPILRMLLDSFDGSYAPRHLASIDHKAFGDRDALRTHIEKRIEARQGLVTDVVLADLGTHMPIAVLDGATGLLSINLEHPFVAHFSDEFGDQKKNLPLQLFAISEILLEASLHATFDSETITTVLDSRDELLRHLARASGIQNSLTVAQDLVAAASNATALEDAVVLAFRQLGFEAVPKGNSDEPDGLAEAFLSPDSAGANHYRVSLEAKTKREPGGKVRKDDVGISTIARHRDEANCDHAIVVGPDFVTGPKDLGAVMREIEADRANNPPKTITLIRIADLARLVRLAPIKRTNLSQLRRLFVDASSPDEAASWVDALAEQYVVPAPYKAILDEVWTLQQEDPDHGVDYGSLRTALRKSGALKIDLAGLKLECAALSRIATPNLFLARDDVVELLIHPTRVLEAIHDYVESVPEKGG